MQEVLSIDQGVRFSNSYAEWLHVVCSVAGMGGSSASELLPPPRSSACGGASVGTEVLALITYNTPAWGQPCVWEQPSTTRSMADQLSWEPWVLLASEPSGSRP